MTVEQINMTVGKESDMQTVPRRGRTLSPRLYIREPRWQEPFQLPWEGSNDRIEEFLTIRDDGQACAILVGFLLSDFLLKRWRKGV
jgi:hypothetical protein